MYCSFCEFEGRSTGGLVCVLGFEQTVGCTFVCALSGDFEGHIVGCVALDFERGSSQMVEILIQKLQMN